MKIGFAKVDITPPIGVYLAGYFQRDRPSIGVHDPLYSRAIAIVDGEKVFAAASVDVLGISLDLFRLVEKYVRELLGDVGIEFSVSAIHTHSGPDLYGMYADFDEVLYELTARRIASSIILAYRNAEDCTGVFHGIGEVGEVAVNRRDPIRGIVDPRVHVVKFECSSAGVVLSNYSCHAVVLGHNNFMISADYPGALNSFVDRASNYNSIFFNGACGDINPFTPNTDLSRVYDRSAGTFGDVEWMGTILGCEVVKQAALARKIAYPRLELKSLELKLKTVKPPYSLSEIDELLSRAEEEYFRAISRGESGFEERWRLFTYMVARHQLENYVDEVTALIKIACLSRDLAMVFVPSEVLVRVGLMIKERSPFRNTLVIAYSNGYFGYMPTAEEYELGGYEVSFPYSIVERGSAEYMVNKVVDALSELKSQYS